MSEVRDVPARSRYELAEDGALAVAEYVLADGVVTFTHTLVPDALKGRGIGTRLIAAALADVRAKRLRVVPQCPFVAAYIDKHPAERDLLA